MENPYASPSSDVSQHEIELGVLQVRWTRPTFGTFASLALLCGFSTGIVVGILSFVGSLFGMETEIFFGIWRLQGITAGLVGILLAPVGGALLGALPMMLYPLFRLGTAVSQGLRLHFQAEDDRRLCLSRLQLRSYIVLSALLGFLFSLFGVICLLLAMASGNVDDYSCLGVPLLFDGTARLIWVVLAGPLLHSIYAAVLGVFTYLPFRFVTRLTGAAIPSQEVLTGG